MDRQSATVSRDIMTSHEHAEPYRLFEAWFKEARDLLKRKERMHEKAAASLEGMGIS